MKNLFDPTDAAEIKHRLLHLTPDSQREWGTMPLDQTLAHCTSSLHMATGDLETRPAPLPARLVGKLIKPIVLGDDKPLRRNVPSRPELFPKSGAASQFELLRNELVAALDDFAGRGPACCTQRPHPFFGKLKPQQWATLMYKHLDHHLRQFGA